MAADILSQNENNEDVRKPFLNRKNGTKVEFVSGMFADV